MLEPRAAHLVDTLEKAFALISCVRPDNGKSRNLPGRHLFYATLLFFLRRPRITMRVPQRFDRIGYFCCLVAKTLGRDDGIVSEPDFRNCCGRASGIPSIGSWNR